MRAVFNSTAVENVIERRVEAIRVDAHDRQVAETQPNLRHRLPQLPPHTAPGHAKRQILGFRVSNTLKTSKTTTHRDRSHTTCLITTKKRRGVLQCCDALSPKPYARNPPPGRYCEENGAREGPTSLGAAKDLKGGSAQIMLYRMSRGTNLIPSAAATGKHKDAVTVVKQHHLTFRGSSPEPRS